MTLSSAVEVLIEGDQDESGYICPLGMCDGDQIGNNGEDCMCVAFNRAEREGEMQSDMERGN